MALLIDLRAPEWMDDAVLRDILAPTLPGVVIHCGPAVRSLADVTMLATVQMQPGMADNLPNLQLIQKMGAGVETMLSDPNLPLGVRVARLEPDVQADEMAEFALAYVYAHLRDISRYLADQLAGRWDGRSPVRASQTTVAVLGLGHIGRRTAEAFVRNGFQVLGWSRSLKTISGVASHAGDEGLQQVLASADFIVSVLPSTPETSGMLTAARLVGCKPGAVLINMGRGDLVADIDLLDALAAGSLGGAVLDVFNHEPLPAGHPFWTHDRIIVTPHVSGWNIDDGLRDVAENYTRLMQGKPLLREIDRASGY